MFSPRSVHEVVSCWRAYMPRFCVIARIWPTTYCDMMWPYAAPATLVRTMPSGNPDTVSVYMSVPAQVICTHLTGMPSEWRSFSGGSPMTTSACMIASRSDVSKGLGFLTTSCSTVESGPAASRIRAI